jgi:hypothetical protein
MKHISHVLGSQIPTYFAEHRTPFFAVLQKTGLEEKITAAQQKTYTVTTKVDIREISINNFLLLSLEERTELSTNPKMPYVAVRKGSMLRIDFCKNEELEYGAKLRDVVPHWVQKVRVTDTMGNKKTGYKKGDIFVGENEKRLVIHSGFLVEIVR